jgi:hypothetical protein
MKQRRLLSLINIFLRKVYTRKKISSYTEFKNVNKKDELICLVFVRKKSLPIITLYHLKANMSMVSRILIILTISSLLDDCINYVYQI